jgi:hypothetical protein
MRWGLVQLQTVALVLVGLSACAAPVKTHKRPEYWSKKGYVLHGATSEKLGTYGEPAFAPVLAKSNLAEEAAGAPMGAGNAARVIPPPPSRASRLKKSACLSELRERGIAFSELKDLRGVETPVHIQGPLGGVNFWANDGRSLTMDCRLALALDDMRPLFKKYDLKRVRYSGAYSFRRTRTGRLSHHAHGLAIDLHDLTFAKEETSVIKDYRKNTGCPTASSRLNELACDMRAARVFQEFLTPDFNYDHRDHLHISVPRPDQR